MNGQNLTKFCIDKIKVGIGMHDMQQLLQKALSLGGAIIEFADNFGFFLLPFSGRVLGNVPCVICADKDCYLLFS